MYKREHFVKRYNTKRDLIMNDFPVIDMIIIFGYQAS